MFTSRFGFGYGMGYAAHKEANAFISLGHSVTVVHCYSSSEIVYFYDPGITLIYLPIKKLPLIGFLIYSFKLKRLLKEKIDMNFFDCIYIQSLEFGLLNLARVKKPIFYFARSTMRGMQKAIRNEDPKKSLVQKIIYQVLVSLELRCMRYSKMIFVKSRTMLREVSKLYSINPHKISVVTGGIDAMDFQILSNSECIGFKQKLGLPLDVPVLLYTGRIVPQKGLVYFIEASLHLLREMNFVVIIAGAAISDSYFAKVKKLVDSSEYQKSFYFLGHVDQRDMSSLFNLADCLVTPSLYEPFGMVNLQAAFLNKKIITTDVTGSIELLANYQEMKVVKSGSAVAIETALREALLWKHRKSEEIFDFQVYSWQNVGQQLIRYFLASGMEEIK